MFRRDKKYHVANVHIFIKNKRKILDFHNKNADNAGFPKEPLVSQEILRPFFS